MEEKHATGAYPEGAVDAIRHEQARIMAFGFEKVHENLIRMFHMVGFPMDFLEASVRIRIQRKEPAKGWTDLSDIM